MSPRPLSQRRVSVAWEKSQLFIRVSLAFAAYEVRITSTRGRFGGLVVSSADTARNDRSVRHANVRSV
jgi:hypothetical protein